MSRPPTCSAREMTPFREDYARRVSELMRRHAEAQMEVVENARENGSSRASLSHPRFSNRKSLWAANAV